MQIVQFQCEAASLCNVAQLRRAAEAAGFRQADKIFKPFGFHGALRYQVQRVGIARQ